MNNNLQNNDFNKDIIFRFKRCGYFGLLLVLLIIILVFFVCFINLYLTPILGGLPSDLGTLVPFFYGFIIFLCLTCWTFIIVNLILFKKKYDEYLKSSKTKILIIPAMILPFILCFIALKIFYKEIDNLVIETKINNKTKINKQKNKKFTLKKPKKINTKSFETFQDKFGKWWYYDDQGNYFYYENDQWIMYKEKK